MQTIDNSFAGSPFTALDSFEVQFPPAMPESVYVLAGTGRLGLRWAANSEPDFGHYYVFLDTDLNREAIRRSLWETARTAERHGFAVGIGHCHRTMLEVLEEELPKLEAEGYRLVSVSEIVR